MFYDMCLGFMLELEDEFLKIVPEYFGALHKPSTEVACKVCLDFLK